MIVAAIVGATGLLLGTGTGIAALVEASDLDCPDERCHPGQQETYDRTVALSHVSTAGFVVAGVGAAVLGIGMVVALWDSEPPSPDNQLGPSAAVRIGPTALWLEGSF